SPTQTLSFIGVPKIARNGPIQACKKFSTWPSPHPPNPKSTISSNLSTTVDENHKFDITFDKDKICKSDVTFDGDKSHKSDVIIDEENGRIVRWILDACDVFIPLPVFITKKIAVVSDATSDLQKMLQLDFS
ncbi:hypothetical protein CR513_53419, partial [Mucuna pruriens]